MKIYFKLREIQLKRGAGESLPRLGCGSNQIVNRQSLLKVLDENARLAKRLSGVSVHQQTSPQSIKGAQ